MREMRHVLFPADDDGPMGTLQPVEVKLLPCIVPHYARAKSTRAIPTNRLWLYSLLPLS